MLLTTAVMIFGLLGVGCGAATPEVVTVEKVVERPVIQTVIVTEEKVVEKAKIETVVVEKEKVVEKPVEKVVEKVVTATPVKVVKPVTLNMNLSTEPLTVDPALAIDTTSVEVEEQLFLGLTDLADDDATKVVPELAASWKASDDGLTWTFYMRDDAVWVHYDPGTSEFTETGPVTAHDVEYGVKRTLNPDTASNYAYVLYTIKNAQAFNTGEKGITADDVGVRAVDDYTVEFTLENPAAFFPAIARLWGTWPQPRGVIEKKGERWIEPGFIITNGPYALAEWVHGHHLTLVKNPLWYGWKDPAIGPGNIERVEYVITEASTALALYENNKLDTAVVPQPDIPRVKADPVLSTEYLDIAELCTYYYGFTMTKPPVDDVRVRKALSAAIDRQTLIDTVTLGDQKPAHSFAPEGIFGNVADDTSVCPWCLDYQMGLEMGRKWLEEAGYPNGQGLDITLMHNVSEGHARIAQAIQAMWKEAYPDMNVNVETQEWEDLLQTLRHETPVEDMPHVWRLGWCADYTDENNWVHEEFNANAGANRPRATPSKFEELTEEAGKLQDPEKRKELYKEAEKILVEEEARIAPIYYYSRVNVTKPWLKRTFSSAWGPQHIHLWTLDWQGKSAATGQ